MFNLLKKRMKNEKGLTLVELLAVVVILAIIAAIAIPAIGNIIDNSRAKALVSDAINVMNAANIYFTDTGKTTTAVTVKTLVDEDYLESAGKLAETSSVTYVSGGDNKITIKESKNGNVTWKEATYTLKDLTEKDISVKNGELTIQ